MIRVADSVVINRPVEEVFAFSVNPDTAPRWRGGVIEARQLSEGPMGVGTKMLFVRTIARRRLESITCVTEYESNRKFLTRDEKGEPFLVVGGMILEPQDGGTKISFDYEAHLGRILRYFEPVLRGLFKKEVQGDFRNLKALLETESAP